MAEPRQQAGEPRRAPAILLLVALSGIFGWWAWQKGAYFGVVWLPGTFILCAVALLLARFAPWPAGRRLHPAAIAAVTGLAALGVWAALSAIWSPAPDVAIGDGQRILAYALIFVLGAWLGTLLGARPTLALIPVAFAGAVAGFAAMIALLTTDAPRSVLDTEATLQFPLGYRNAEAALFGIAVFAALGLAADRRLMGWARAVALGTATLCIDCFLLAQSRGSVIAMTVALVVYVVAAPRRLRAVIFAALAVVPAAAFVPALVSLYEAGQHGAADAIGEMRTAGATAAANAAVAAALGAVAAWLDSRRWSQAQETPRRANLAVLGGLAGLAVAGVIAFVIAVGDPGQWFSDRWDEFRTAGSPDLTESSSRFGFNAGSDRYDLWRVAIDEAGRKPVLGDGGGGYQYSYLRHRTVEYQQVHDAHSVELETLSELGIPGLALLLVALVGGAIAVIAARATGPPGSELAAIALAAGAYWLVHTSIDWFWPYPAVTAPVIALAGSAAAGSMRSSVRARRMPWRAVLAGACAVLALSTIAPFLSERYINQAYAEWRTDLDQAFDDLDRARNLNQLADLPLLARGAIASASGRRADAIDAFSDAAEERPEEWAAHYLLARLQERSDPAEARRQIAIALDENPLEPRVRSLSRRLERSPPGRG